MILLRNRDGVLLLISLSSKLLCLLAAPLLREYFFQVRMYSLLAYKEPVRGGKPERP